jgi:hypothetical protein
MLAPARTDQKNPHDEAALPHLSGFGHMPELGRKLLVRLAACVASNRTPAFRSMSAYGRRFAVKPRTRASKEGISYQRAHSLKYFFIGSVAIPGHEVIKHVIVADRKRKEIATHRDELGQGLHIGIVKQIKSP